MRPLKKKREIKKRSWLNKYKLEEFVKRLDGPGYESMSEITRVMVKEGCVIKEIEGGYLERIYIL